MSELDRLTGHSHSLSGVPMRPKKPVAAPDPTALVSAALVELANVLAARDEKLASTLTNVLTSRPTAETLRPRSLSMNFTKNAAGLLEHGTVSNGQRTWALSINRAGGDLSINIEEL